MEELADALANKKLPPDAAKVALRTLDASGRQIPALSEALTKAGGLTSGPRELSADEMKALVAEVAEKGNAHRGETIYRRNELNCLKCHAIGGAGGRVGPDMLSLGSSAQIDDIAESLLAPNKKVKTIFDSLVRHCRVCDVRASPKCAYARATFCWSVGTLAFQCNSWRSVAASASAAAGSPCTM